MREALEAHGTMNDFIGQAADNDFIIITTPEAAPKICKMVTKRFDEECKVFYPFRFRDAGKVTYEDIDGVTREADPSPPLKDAVVAPLPAPCVPMSNSADASANAA